MIYSFHSCTLPPPTSVPLSFLSFSTFTCLLCLQLITPRFFFPPNPCLFTLTLSSPPPPPPGPSVVLLPGGGWAGFPRSLGSRSGRAQSYVVCCGPGPVWLGPGGVAKGLVRHPTAGLEGRATEVTIIFQAQCHYKQRFTSVIFAICSVTRCHLTRKLAAGCAITEKKLQ